MQDAQAAIRDFEPALKMIPNSGIARLGLAFSYLQLHRSREALEETNKAESFLANWALLTWPARLLTGKCGFWIRRVSEYRVRSSILLTT